MKETYPTLKAWTSNGTRYKAETNKSVNVKGMLVVWAYRYYCKTAAVGIAKEYFPDNDDSLDTIVDWFRDVVTEDGGEIKGSITRTWPRQ